MFVGRCPLARGHRPTVVWYVPPEATVAYAEATTDGARKASSRLTMLVWVAPRPATDQARGGLARSERSDIRDRMDGILDTKVIMLSGSISRSLMADAIAKGARGFVSKEKPVGVIIEALEMAHPGHLAVALPSQERLWQERRSATGRSRLTRAPAGHTEANLRRGGFLAAEPPI